MKKKLKKMLKIISIVLLILAIGIIANFIGNVIAELFPIGAVIILIIFVVVMAYSIVSQTEQ